MSGAGERAPGIEAWALPAEPRALADAAASAASAQQRRTAAVRVLLAVAVFAVAAAAAMADILVGSGTLPGGEVVRALLAPATAAESTVFIVWELRLPMTLMALVTGAALATSGLLMQTVLDNPLAEPFTLGVSSAAGFGAALALGFSLSLAALLPGLPAELTTAANAFLFALFACGLVLALSHRSGTVQTITLLGIGLHFAFSALLSLIQYMASVDQLQSIVFWLMGSLQRATWLKVEVASAIVLVALPVVLAHVWSLTALRSFGDQAEVYGVRVKRVRAMMLVIAALLAAAVTAVVGIVGFIGMVSPHVARLLVGEDHRFTLPVTIGTGAAFAALASLASKVVIPGAVLPLGMVTSLVGLPFFIALVLRRSRSGLA